MALFDRNDDRGYGYRGDMNRGRGGGFLDRVQNAFRGQDTHVNDEHLRRDYENRSSMDTGAGMNRGWNAGGTGYSRPMDREGGLHQRNSWSDGAWTADAAERTDREWSVQNRGRMDYDHDMSPFQAGWRAGGMHGGMTGGMGMNRGMPRDLNLGTGDREWGHTGNLGGNRYDRGFAAGGTHRGGGFLDRAQNAVRRGWDNLEDRFDRDDDDRSRMHLGGGAMRGGSSWAGQYDRDWHQPSDLRGYRDGEGHYGVTHSPGMMGGSAGMGMNRYGADYDRDMNLHRGGGMMNRGGMDYDRGYKGREQTDAGDPFGDRQSHTPIRVTGGNRGNLNRYDNGYGRGRDWF